MNNHGIVQVSLLREVDQLSISALAYWKVGLGNGIICHVLRTCELQLHLILLSQLREFTFQAHPESLSHYYFSIYDRKKDLQKGETGLLRPKRKIAPPKYLKDDAQLSSAELAESSGCFEMLSAMIPALIPLSTMIFSSLQFCYFVRILLLPRIEDQSTSNHAYIYIYIYSY